MKRTRIAQIVYAAVMGVAALLIFLFRQGTPYAFPLGILISAVLTLYPVNLVCLFFDTKRYFQSDRQAADQKEMVWSVLWFYDFMYRVAPTRLL